MAKSFLNRQDLTRGIRNNNPGNLRYTTIPWYGKIPYAQNTDANKSFEQFQNINYGIRAMAIDLFNDVKQNGYSLAQLIYEFAPAHENNTSHYIQEVSSATGIAPSEEIIFDHESLAAVIRAMIMMENGPDGNLIADQDIQDSILLMPQLILSELGEYVKAHKKGIAGVLLLGATTAFLGYQVLKRRAA